MTGESHDRPGTIPALDIDEVHVWCASLDAPAEELARLRGILNHE
jgi:hypothetical protein